jgi:hypothetical protein
LFIVAAQLDEQYLGLAVSAPQQAQDLTTAKYDDRPT